MATCIFINQLALSLFFFLQAVEVFGQDLPHPYPYTRWKQAAVEIAYLD